MSSQTSYLEAALPAPVKPVAAPRPRRAVSGAGLLSGAMVLSGLLTYAFLVLAARALGILGKSESIVPLAAAVGRALQPGRVAEIVA